MQNRIWKVILLTAFVLFFGSKGAFAVETPNFPSCTNPQGEVKVEYNDGIHAVVGDSNQYSGRDIVYQLDGGNLSQCLCTSGGQGIQTNWWKISSLDEEQLQELKNEGWIPVPNGALWGLEETAYMTLNSTFSCANGSNGGSGGDGGDGRSDGLGCATRDCSNQGGVLGEVLGASVGIGEVLGLASTGGSFLPYALAIIGVASLAFGVLLNIKSSKK